MYIQCLHNNIMFTLGWVIHMFDVVLVHTSITTSHIMDYMRQARNQARRQISLLISYVGARPNNNNNNKLWPTSLDNPLT